MVGSDRVTCQNGQYPTLPECVASNCTETPNVANAADSWNCMGTWCSSVGVRVFVTIECATVSRLRHRPTRHSFISQENQLEQQRSIAHLNFTKKPISHSNTGTRSGDRCDLQCEEGYTATDGPLCFAGSFIDTALCNPDPCQPGSVVIEHSRTGLGPCAGTWCSRARVYVSVYGAA